MKFLPIISLMLLLSQALESQAGYDGTYKIIDVPCEDGFAVFRSKCYKVVKGEADYATAVYICKTLYKGKLYALRDTAEQELFRNIGKGVLGIENDMWIRGNWYSSREGVLCTVLPLNNNTEPYSGNCNIKNSFVCEKTRKDESRYKDFNTMEETVSALLERLERKLAALEGLVLHPTLDGIRLDKESSKIRSDDHRPVLSCAAPPVVILSPEMDEVTVVAGENLTLTCEAYGNPNPNITWITPNITEKRTFIRIVGNIKESTLTITNVQNYHKGKYTCIGINNIGIPVSESIEVHVLHPPLTQVQQERSRESIKLICLVKSNPPPEVFWMNEVTREVLSSNVTRLNESFTLVEYNVSRFDRQTLGPYLCMANNSYGSSSSRIYVLIVPYEVKITDARETSRGLFQLTFNASSYYDIQQYKLSYKSSLDYSPIETYIPSSGMKPTNLVNYTEKYEIQTVPGRKYEAKLMAKNEHGWSPVSPEYGFNSTFVCGQNVTAEENWRHLISHERYGIDKLQGYFKCRSFIFADEGLEIEFYEVDSKLESYPSISNEGRDMKTFLIAGNNRNYLIYNQKSLLLPGKQFELRAQTSRETSKGFAARFREAKRGPNSRTSFT